jgi:hypothetical protein
MSIAGRHSLWGNLPPGPPGVRASVPGGGSAPPVLLCSPSGPAQDSPTSGAVPSRRPTARWTLGPTVWRADHRPQSRHDSSRCGRPARRWAEGRGRAIDHGAYPPQACTVEHVAQPERGAAYDLKRYGRTPHHPFHEERWGDADVTPAFGDVSGYAVWAKNCQL